MEEGKMLNPIRETASAMMTSEVIRGGPNNTSPEFGGTAQLEVVKQVGPRPTASDGLPKIKTSDKEGAEHGTAKRAKEEVRKSEINDGQLTVKVYDSSGKLLRKIPPGYLPMGEQKFDITV